MKQAAICGATTGAGTFLAIVAVYQGVRLDWAETALVAGITLLAVGILRIKDMVEELCGRR